MSEQEAYEGPEDEKQRDEQRQILCPCILQCLEDTWNVLDLLLNRHMDVSGELSLILRAKWLNQILVIELELL